MTIGKTLWLIVLIKLFVMFVVLRIFFFPNYLNTNFKDDNGKANHVRHELIKNSNQLK
jgi:Na+/H+ antiporter NhaD/arsenite permease-like protein